jgi:hypothetical protein
MHSKLLASTTQHLEPSIVYFKFDLLAMRSRALLYYSLPSWKPGLECSPGQASREAVQMSMGLRLNYTPWPGVHSRRVSSVQVTLTSIYKGDAPDFRPYQAR